MSRADLAASLRRMAEIAFNCFRANCEDNGATQKEIRKYWLESEERKELRSLYRKALRSATWKDYQILSGGVVDIRRDKSNPLNLDLSGMVTPISFYKSHMATALGIKDPDAQG